MTQAINPNDIVFTPSLWARDIVEFFKPSGLVLDPCRGAGAFFDELPEPKTWCEISEGVDFFAFDQKVDWIISNPPYSTFSKWLDHSLKLADHIVYLIPVNKILSSLDKLQKVEDYGGIHHIRYYGTGRDAGFPFGFPVGAVYLKRGFKGPVDISWYHTARQRAEKKAKRSSFSK
jgi:hypothetical protein